MCKIITIINKNKKNDAVINQLLTVNAPELAREKDGYAVYEYADGLSNRRTYVGDEAYNKIPENIEYHGSEVYMAHFRTKTAGGQSGEGGLHLDKIQDRYVYAHNGTASKFSGAKTKSDSYHFFNALLAKGINGKTITHAIYDSHFWGRAFVFDEKENRLHVFSNYNIQIYGMKDCLIFSSYLLETKIIEREVQIIMGFPFYVDSVAKPLPLLGESEFTDEYLTFTNGELDHDEYLDISCLGKKKEEPFDATGSFWNPETGMFEYHTGPNN